MEIIAHRGAAFDAPENTLEAFDLAIQQGAQRLELDIQLTRDGVAIVHHDETTGRLTGRDFVIAASTLDELRDLKLPNGESILTFSELCAAVQGRVELDVELKVIEPTAAERLLQTMADHELLESSLITSFEVDALRIIRQVGFEGRTGLVVGSNSRSLRQRAYEAWPFPAWKHAQANDLVIHHRLYHPLLRHYLNANDGKLLFWMSIEDETRDVKKRARFYRRIAELQPDGVILSRIEEATEIFDAIAAKTSSPSDTRSNASQV